MPIERIIQTEIPFPHRVVTLPVPHHRWYVAGSVLRPDNDGRCYTDVGLRLIIVNGDTITIRARGSHPQQYRGEDINNDWLLGSQSFFPLLPDLLFSYRFQYKPHELRGK